MSYQTVIRNAGGVLVTNQAVSIKISLLQGSATGTAMYIETQHPTTNANGLASLQIGGGTVVSGTFASIDWANGPYFIKTETDPAGGSNYSVVGTSQLLSVAYALQSNNSDSTKAVKATAGNSIVNAINATTSTINPSNLGTGTPSSSNYLRGDGSWATPTASSGGLGYVITQLFLSWSSYSLNYYQSLYGGGIYIDTSYSKVDIRSAIMPVSGSIDNLYVECSAYSNFSTPHNFIITLCKNGLPTNLSVSIISPTVINTSAIFTDKIHSIAFNAGDKFSFP